MTVYADILVIVNLYIDFFLLWCVKRFFRLRVKNRRLIPGALAGALLSLTALLPGGPLSFLLGVATAFASTAAAFAPCPWRTLLRATLCFYLFTLLLAGFFLFLLRFFSPRHMAVLGNVLYFQLSPLLLFVFTLGAYAVFFLAQRLLPAAANGAHCRWLTLENRGKCARVFAKADTGNQLREPFSGLPVLVCEWESVQELAPPGLDGFWENGELPAAPGLRLVPFQSLGGSGVLPAFQPDRVTAEGEPLPCYVAVCRQKLSGGQYQALYHPDLLANPKTETRRYIT